MGKIKDDLGQNISQQGNTKIRRQKKADAEVKLILLPCLCDLYEMRARALRADASAGKMLG